MLTQENHRQGQADHNRLVMLSKEWQLYFNESKWKILHLGSKIRQLDYQMNHMIMMSDIAEKDLSITIVTKLKFHDHRIKTVNIESTRLGFVKTFTCLIEITVQRYVQDREWYR